MVRNHGIPKAFEVDATFAADRKIGQLVRVKPNGKITNVLGESKQESRWTRSRADCIDAIL